VCILTAFERLVGFEGLSECVVIRIIRRWCPCVGNYCRAIRQKRGKVSRKLHNGLYTRPRDAL